MTSRSIQVEILTASFRVTGRVTVPFSGMLGILCDTTTSYLGITPYTISLLNSNISMADQSNYIRVVKRHIIAACLIRKEDVSPPPTGRGLTRPSRYLVHITTPTHEMEGSLEWPGRFDFTAIMAEGVCDFIPLYDAKLRANHFPDIWIGSPAILFNLSYLDTLILLDDKE